MSINIAEIEADIAAHLAAAARLAALLPVPANAPEAPRLRITQQSDGRWIWTREEGTEAINLGWSGSTKAIVGSHAARMKRPMVEVIAAAIRREYGTDVIVTPREGVEP